MILQQEIPPLIKVLGATKVESGGVSMMLKTGMKVSQYYTVFNYGPPRPHNNVNFQYITIVAAAGVNLAMIFFFSQGTVRRNLGREPPHVCCSWITWKHHCPPHWKRLVGTQVGPLWRVSSNPEHHKCLATRYVCWMIQDIQLYFKNHMGSFSTVILVYG